MKAVLVDRKGFSRFFTLECLIPEVRVSDCAPISVWNVVGFIDQRPVEYTVAFHFKEWLIRNELALYEQSN
jgi:hypothetical protein